MRSEENPLDLNNLPEDYYSKDGKQVLVEDTSSYAGSCRKKKSGGGKDGKEECGKVYECRFCSLKFCKSQALGGHMNRHRQERETETLNRARQLVFNNDNTLLTPPPHLGCQPIPHGGYHHIGGDPTIQAFRSVYPTRLFSSSSSNAAMLPSSGQPYMYTSPSRLVPFPSQHPPPPASDYLVGHVIPGASAGNNNNNHQQQPENIINNYTCIGAPVSNFLRGPPDEGGHDNWAGRAQQCLDPSSINQFQDGF